MGVYIPKMEMPRNCGECLFGKCESCHMNLMIYGHDRTDCPLVEVKPHGRLIDADVLKVKSLRTIIQNGLEHDRKVLWQMIDDAPTTLEADYYTDTVNFGKVKGESITTDHIEVKEN